MTEQQPITECLQGFLCIDIIYELTGEGTQVQRSFSGVLTTFTLWQHLDLNHQPLDWQAGSFTTELSCHATVFRNVTREFFSLCAYVATMFTLEISRNKWCRHFSWNFYRTLPHDKRHNSDAVCGKVSLIFEFNGLCFVYWFALLLARLPHKYATIHM